jgi:hypothetical protein
MSWHLGPEGKSGGKPHGTQEEILLKYSKKLRDTDRPPGLHQTSDRHQRQGGGIFSEDNPEEGIGVVIKPPLGKCSINIPFNTST